MNKRAGIFLIAIIALIVLLMSYGIVYFRFTSSGLEVLAGNTTVSLGYDNNLSVSNSSSNFSSETKSQPLNLGINDSSNIVVNTSATNTVKSNRTKIEIVEVNISK
jgi:flagellar basal body-associated protein FliL